MLPFPRLLIIVTSTIFTVMVIAQQHAMPSAGDIRTNPRDGAEMVYIPAGDFLMGSGADEGTWLGKNSPGAEVLATEQPQHTIKLDGFWIYKVGVTAGQYRKFCRATQRAMPDLAGGAAAWQENEPIGNVNWFEADAYAQWAGGMLPSEAQWEKAARGTDGRRYPWGNDWDANKCLCPYNNVNLQPGSTAGAGPYGVCDMAGSKWTWCRDWYDPHYYATSPAENPTGPATGIRKALRGGSTNTWSGGLYFRSTFRDAASPPGYRFPWFGIRVVLPESR